MTLIFWLPNAIKYFSFGHFDTSKLEIFEYVQYTDIKLFNSERSKLFNLLCEQHDTIKFDLKINYQIKMEQILNIHKINLLKRGETVHSLTKNMPLTNKSYNTFSNDYEDLNMST